MSASRLLGLMVVAALALGGCKREERDYRPTPAAAARDRTISLSSLQAGGPSAPIVLPNAYEESAYAVSEGQRLYRWYNCNGCHANGGGDKGPALMDDVWIYGSKPAQIYSTIVEGRPNGMPSFGGHIPDNEVWQRQLERVYGSVEKVDLLVGMHCEKAPPGFGFSDTAFRIFILMASRRLKSDRFFTVDFRPEVYTPMGFDWIRDNNFRSVLERHFPQLAPRFADLRNIFFPWDRGGH